MTGSSTPDEWPWYQDWMHDATAVRTEGIEEQLRLHPNVKAEVDSGYAGLARDFPRQASAPPKKPAADAGPGNHNSYDHARRRQSERRIMVDHANAEVKQWRPLQRWTGDRDDLPEVIAAIGALVPDAHRVRDHARPARQAQAARPTSRALSFHNRFTELCRPWCPTSPR